MENQHAEGFPAWPRHPRLASRAFSDLLCECLEQPGHAPLHQAVSQIVGQLTAADDAAGACKPSASCLDKSIGTAITSAVVAKGYASPFHHLLCTDARPLADCNCKQNTACAFKSTTSAKEVLPVHHGGNTSM